MRAQLLCRTDLGGLHWYLSGGWNKFCAAQSFEISIDFSMSLHQGFAQSNGLVERTVQTAKKLLKKTYEDNKNPYSGVYFTKYFNSWRWSFFHSVAHGASHRSIIPTKNILLKPMAYDPVKFRKCWKKKNGQLRRSILIEGTSPLNHENVEISECDGEEPGNQ